VAGYVSLKATRPGHGNTELEYRQYRCGMCGGVRYHTAGREKPEYCKDCEPEAIRLGWMDPRPPRKRRSKT